MKRLFISFISAALVWSVKASDCELNISVIPPQTGENLPEQVASQLTGKLRTILSSSGVSTSVDDLQFFLTGRFDHAYYEKTSGPDQRDVINTTLTLYIGDADGQKIFASKELSLKGVGKSEAQAYIKAMAPINGHRKDIVDFIEEGKSKILEYFDNNYQNYLTKAKNAMNKRNYEEALYLALQIPECCIGFGEAQALALEIYNHEVDYLGNMLLTQAKAAFSADPTDKGAYEAFSYLSQIDPNASCYKEALAYGDKMAKDVKSQWAFNNIRKYKDELALKHKLLDNQAAIEKSRIESARAIGVAWAKSQQTGRNYFNWY